MGQFKAYLQLKNINYAEHSRQFYVVYLKCQQGNTAQQK